MFTNPKFFLHITLILFIIGFFVLKNSNFFARNTNNLQNLNSQNSATDDLKGEDNTKAPHPLSVEALRNGEYPGSDLNIEQVLDPGVNYSRQIASYKSEGLKIYGLLTIPNGEPPETGWPVIIFNHGYIPPTEYRTTERYIAYLDTFARNGYVVFKSDYRGHGNSEGAGAGGYGTNAYTIDVLNAVSSIKKFNNQLSSGIKVIDVNRIGMWGHSMGGHITLRNMVVNKDIKAGVIWAGVVASYPDLINNWRRGSQTPQPIPSGARRWRQSLVEEFGTPEQNPAFWASISSNTFLSDISGPLQLHHATGDTSVPVEFSRNLEKELKTTNKPIEYFEYQGDDHNISQNFNTAINRSLQFFDKHLKNEKI